MPWLCRCPPADNRRRTSTRALSRPVLTARTYELRSLLALHAMYTFNNAAISLRLTPATTSSDRQLVPQSCEDLVNVKLVTSFPMRGFVTMVQPADISTPLAHSWPGDLACTYGSASSSITV